MRSPSTSKNMLEQSEGVCVLEVTRHSEEEFSKTVLKNKYEFVYLNLVFNDVNVNEGKAVISHTKWVWTFRGENGGSELLLLPIDFGYLSFGLLWSHTLVKPLDIHIQLKDNSHCKNLTVGVDADQIIGDALGNMTKTIADVNDDYNSSYWCYYKRMYIESKGLYRACENAICPLQTIEYSCCKYRIDFLTRKRKVVCNEEHYHTGAIWWILPVMIGEVLFAYWPLLLTSLANKLRSFSRHPNTGFLSQRMASDGDSRNEYEGVSKRNPPVTFLATVCEPLSHCNTEGHILSRILRLTIIACPVCLTVARIGLDYLYNDDLMKAAVHKGALLGFSTMLLGCDASANHFLKFFGGPCVALPLFALFGCTLIVVPRSLETVLEEGLIEFKGKASYLMTLSVENKAKLAGVRMTNTSGYKRLHLTLLSQCLMLLNRSYWKQTFKLFITRFTMGVYPTLSTLTRKLRCVRILGILVLPVYIVFCVIELVLSSIYYAFPCFSCVFIFIKAYFKLTRKIVSERTNLNPRVSLIPNILVICILFFSWYMYCIIFFDSFWFLTKIVTFTFTGVIAYPKLSYGYITIVFMTIYYISESFSSFQKTYQDLLSVSIKACKKVNEDLGSTQTVSHLYENGIKQNLWNLIIKRHRPKRIQVAYTLFQLFVIIFIVSVSLELLFRFDKFRDLSVLIHVFTALFICAMPKIIQSMCIGDHRKRGQKQKLMSEIKETINDYLDGETETDFNVFQFTD